MEEFAKQMDDANHNSVTQDREKKVTQIQMMEFNEKELFILRLVKGRILVLDTTSLHLTVLESKYFEKSINLNYCSQLHLNKKIYVTQVCHR